ncbi:DNA (cytosine-5-)-methyltransferase [Cupriavidus oxalaticus]|uniref:Cytosine-specific methyltransferase n=2 Tax=Cupriavidus oxalaticus TaxID=96344 RepID=A0A5P3VFU6_9BURK|nr:DNA (cytosine-5-)-methyltransferase [Cupriavidus oxalaticus]
MPLDKNVIPLSRKTRGRSVELFSGCGGLAFGLAFAGFKHDLLVEWDDHACNTVNFNKARRLRQVSNWPLAHADVRDIEWERYRGTDLVAGGPPCQPFSVGGKAAGDQDKRDMWPEAIRAVREIQPRAFIFENVRGLLRPAFSDYVNWIVAYLENPELVRGPMEPHLDHLSRLRAARDSASYEVRVIPVNAADYGAPQKRNRVLVVGMRKDIGALPDFPAPTHSQERLVWDKWVSAEYWEGHGLPRPADSLIPNHEARILRKLRLRNERPTEKAWLTCRDAFSGLGEPSIRHDTPNHIYQPGARVYPGHTGSPIDEPAKALKAGVHGVPGGENMLAREDGSVRYFSIREAARLQGLPDEYQFPGSWTESMRQIGNAVPTQLAHFVGLWLGAFLQNKQPITKVA